MAALGYGADTTVLLIIVLVVVLVFGVPVALTIYRRQPTSVIMKIWRIMSIEAKWDEDKADGTETPPHGDQPAA